MVAVTPILGNGIYTVSEAARLTQISPRCVQAWFTGWAGSGEKPVLKADYPEIGKARILSFLDLIDVVVVAKLRAARASMPAVRRVYQILSNRFDSKHPFGHRQLLTDEKGKPFLLLAAEEGGDPALIDLIRNQHVFPMIVLPFLKKVEFNEATSLASLLHLRDGILLDPSRHFGKPIVSGSSFPTSILSRAFLAHGGDADSVAEWYGVRPREVLQAVDFEASLNQAA